MALSDAIREARRLWRADAEAGRPVTQDMIDARDAMLAAWETQARNQEATLEDCRERVEALALNLRRPPYGAIVQRPFGRREARS
jgi:hypothetical protein